MAKAPAPRTDQVEQWVQMTLALTQAAADYAASGEEDEATTGMIRKLRVLSASFMAALNALPLRPPGM